MRDFVSQPCMSVRTPSRTLDIDLAHNYVTIDLRDDKLTITISPREQDLNIAGIPVHLVDNERLRPTFRYPEPEPFPYTGPKPLSRLLDDLAPKQPHYMIGSCTTWEIKPNEDKG